MAESLARRSDLFLLKQHFRILCWDNRLPWRRTVDGNISKTWIPITPGSWALALKLDWAKNFDTTTKQIQLDFNVMVFSLKGSY